MGDVMRTTVIASAICFCLVGLCQADNVKAAIRKSTNIPAEELGSALQTLAKDYDFQVLYRTEIVSNLRTQGAIGEFTPDDALKKLLSGTGLTYKYLDEKTVTIVSRDSSQAADSPRPDQSQMPSDPGNEASSKKEAGKKTSQDFRVAQVDQGGNSQTSTVGSNTATTQEGPNKVGLEEIVVTAQKREERLIDVPISIVAIDSKELQERQITRLDDLTSVVPGLAIQSGGNSQRRIELRGVGNTYGTFSLIGLYLDEADVTSAGEAQLDLVTYDLQRVEVLRGPQGTLYGEGSAGGTIRFITKNPILDRVAIETDVAALFTPGAAPGQRINAMLNVPVIEGEMGLRIAGTFDHEGGWINQPAADQKNINGQNLSDVRIKGLWEPNQHFTVNAMTEIHRNQSGTNSGEDANGNYTQVFNLTTTPRVQDDFDIYNLTLTYDFDSVRFLSATSYVKQDKQVTNFGYILQLTPPGTPPFEVDQRPIDRTSSQRTQEFRLSSIGSGPWEWTVGGIYRRFQYALDETYYFDVPGPLPSTTYPYDNNTISNSWAAFGDTSYRVMDRLTVGAGLRYFRDRQQDVSGLGTTATTQTGEFHSLDPRAYAQFKFTDDVNVYASVAKGFRSGGFNALGQPSYGPESVLTYELGSKMSDADHRLSAELAVFYSDYTDYQVVGISALQPVNITRNAGDAWLKGIEWGLTWRPVSLWALSFNGDYTPTRFYKINATSSSYAVGDPIDLSPKYAFTVAAQRDFSLGGKLGDIRVDYDQRGPATYRNRSISGPTPWYFNQSDTIHMLNTNIGLHWTDNLRLGLFAQNLLNDRGFIDPLSIEHVAARSRPRTFGIEFGTTF
jgi:iron complex outermembrane receptor protein